MRKVIAAVAALGLLLASGAPVHAIVGSAPDGSGHPNVGALIGTIDDGHTYYFVCSGSLLADDRS
jgi:hypothetical protein